MMRSVKRRWALGLGACLLIGAVPGEAGQGATEAAVRRARTRTITPRATPPAWMDYEKVRLGYGFLDAHSDAVTAVLTGSSLAATFAAKDVAPVLMQTGKLPKSFTPRMMATGMWMNTIFRTPKDKETFVSRSYAQAVALGQLHTAVAEAVRAPLGWDPKVRAPMNGQAYAFVLYSFAYWPVEAMIADKTVDPVEDAPQLDAWYHFWSVIGYGMGVPEDLLPRSAARAREVVVALRKAQYAAPGERLPDGIPVLLGGNVRLGASLIAASPKARAAGATPANSLPAAAKALADLIARSPGEAEALGLGKDPAARLLEYAALPPSK